MTVETTGASRAAERRDENDVVGELERRLMQQSLVADFGRFALENDDLDAILTKACALAAQGLEVTLAKVLERRRDSEDFLIRAGVGWRDGVVGVATIPGGMKSPAGYAFETGEPVISNHLGREDRFRTPEIMVEHGVQRAINVLLGGSEDRYGVLESDSKSEGAFSVTDINFLESLANTLGVAIEKEADRARIIGLNASLREALDVKDMMGREIDHRVKNSLSIVSGLLSMQSRTVESDEAKHALSEASGRISTIAQVHGTLYQADGARDVDFGTYLSKLARELVSAHTDGNFGLSVEADSMRIDASDAMSLGLVAAELITNAVKHSRAQGSGGAISVRCSEVGAMLVLSVTDDGAGLPDGFDVNTTTGLGMKIIRSLTTALGGTFAPESVDAGARFVVRMPLAKLSAPN